MFDVIILLVKSSVLCYVGTACSLSLGVLSVRGVPLSILVHVVLLSVLCPLSAQ